MIWACLRRHPTAVDTVLALVLAAAYLGEAARGRHWMPGIVLALAMSLPLLLRRSKPLAVLAIVTAATAVNAVFYEQLAPFAAALAIYTAASYARRRPAFVASLIAAATLFSPSAAPRSSRASSCRTRFFSSLHGR